MTVSARFLEYVIEQLGALRAVRANRMFNGVGLYSEEVFFAVLHEDTLYFKTGESNIAAYRARGMARFQPFPDRAGTTLGYHQVPADILEDAELLVEWARAAVSVALAKSASAARRKPKGKSRAKKVAAKKAPSKKSKQKKSKQKRLRRIISRR